MIILKFVIVSIIVSFLFGMTVLSSSIIKKKFRKDYISPYLFQIWSLILFIIIWYYFKSELYIFNTSNLLNLNNLLFFLMAVVPTSIIVYLGNKLKPTTPIGDGFLKGASMEILQRLLGQNLFVLLGANITLFGTFTLDIFLNALIWIQFIIVQEVMGGKKVSSAILPEVIASFWFSIWVGILYIDTGNIIMPMLAHGLERILAYKIREKFGNIEINQIRNWNIIFLYTEILSEPR